MVSEADEGRGKAAISPAQLPNKLRRGFPNGETRPGKTGSLWIEHIDPVEGTGGTETSKYPRGKEIIPLVAASERGEAQTGWIRPSGVVGPDIVKLPIVWLGERPWNGRPERVRAP